MYIKENFFVTASYPGQNPSLTPDDDVFKHLATVYAQNHPTMHKGTECHDTSFPGGIVNGAAWYSFDGTDDSTTPISHIHVFFDNFRWNVGL